MLSLIVLSLLAAGSAGVAAVEPTSAGAGQFGTPLTMSTGSDNGFLACAAAVLAPNFRNDNTSQAFDNLAGAPSPSTQAVISGHGNSGLICTGNGDHCGAAGTIVANWNQAQWQASAAKIVGKFGALRLLGCDVGADQEGADLLYQMATVTKMPVDGPTYLVWCGGGNVWTDPKSKWQRATPTNKPAPIPKPTFATGRATTLKFKIDGKMVSVPRKSVRVTRLQLVALGKDASDMPVVPGPTAVEIGDMIGFGAPFEPGGVPAAIVTARLTLEITLQGKAPIEREFVLYNDELAQDVVSREVFYPVDSRVGVRLRALRK